MPIACKYRWYTDGDGMAVRLSRAERREQTRQELLTAAEACFVTRGFHATSVDEVAERAGYTKGAVYSNFASKEDLFFAVYERRVEQVLTEVEPGLRRAGAEYTFDWLATTMIERRDRNDGWLAVFFEFWGHVVRYPELRERFAAIHARFLEPLAEAVQQLADHRGLALPADLTASQVVLAWNAMEIGLGLERLTQPQTVDVVVARRMGWLLLDAVLATTQPSAGNGGQPQDRRIR
jgi:AcrR family transcriptional regulator